MREKEKEDIKVILCIMAVIVAICLIGAVGEYTDNLRSAEKRMDAWELHFDADDYFLMMDATNGLTGFYYATSPLKHMKIRTDAPNGTYEAYFHGGEMYLELIGVDATITVPLTKKQAAWIDEHYKDGYPALVYRER